MAIVKQLYDNKYISLYTENNITIWSKLALYNSTFNTQYNIITDVVITIDNKPFYKATGIHIPYNTKGLISIADYVEKIAALLQYTNFEDYNKKIILDKFFKDSHTIQLNLIYKSVLADQKHERKIQEYNNYRTTVETLTDEIINIANSKDILVCINPHERIRLIKEQIENRNIIDRQLDKNFIKMILDYSQDQIKDFFIKDIEPEQTYNIGEWELEINLLKDAKEYVLSI